MAKGQRINLAELANEDFYDPADEVTPAPAAPPTPGRSDPSGDGAPLIVPTRTVVPNPLNARPAGDDDEIDELADSIRAGVGMLTPVMVCPADLYCQEYPDQAGAVNGADWVAIMGNRRLRAAIRADVQDLSVIITREPGLMFEMMLVENVQRRPLPPLHEARAMESAKKSGNLSTRELARRMGKSHMYVQQRLALLGLVPELAQALEDGDLKIELAREFGTLPAEQQREIAQAGKPYRKQGVNAVSTARPRSIRVSSPSAAAQSIRERFSEDELQELIRLLSDGHQ